MVSSSQFLVLSCVVFICLLNFATGLQCRDCSDCDETDNSTLIIDSEDIYYCFKLVYSDSGRTAVDRGGTSFCKPGKSYLLGPSGTIYCCWTDLCNSGITKSASIILIAVVAMVMTVFRIYV